MKLEIKSIPPVTNFDITYYDKINNEWWVVDKIGFIITLI